MTLTITLHDGSEHVARYTTMTAMMPLLKPVFGDDLTQLTEASAANILPQLLQGLGDADFVRDLANGLLTVFPTLPNDRVWFNDASRSTPYGVAGLEVTEILLIVARCLESLNNNPELSSEKFKEFAQQITPQSPVEPKPKAFKPSKKKKR